MGLNLASEPFVDRRVVQRTAGLLVAAGLVLVAINAFAYWTYFTGEGAMKRKGQDLARQIEEERELVLALDGGMTGIDIDGLNQRIRQVNQQIVERRFEWSRLFDQLGDVLPDAVRLVSLSPQFGDQRARTTRTPIRGSRRGEDHAVLLEMRGVAKSSEALLEFVDRLYADASFQTPNLTQEAKMAGGFLRFSLSARYLAGVEAAAPAGKGAEEAEAAER